jgi:hypothetical protein
MTYKDWNSCSLWQLADCDDYSAIAGHFLFVSPDGEDDALSLLETQIETVNAAWDIAQAKGFAS